MKNLMMRLWKDEEGQDLIEYALLLTFILLLTVATLQSIGGKVNAIFTDVNTALT